MILLDHEAKMLVCKGIFMKPSILQMPKVRLAANIIPYFPKVCIKRIRTTLFAESVIHQRKCGQNSNNRIRLLL